MKATFAVCLLLSGCVGSGGGDGKEPVTGGDGDEETGGVDSGGDSGDTPAPEVVVTVCSEGEADYPTVQAGVDGAPDDAVVQLCGESFAEEVVVTGRTLTLRGEPGAALDGGGDGRALVVDGTTAPTDVTVEGLVITDGFAETGGALWCDSATLTLTDVEITDSLASDSGGGFAASNCIVSLERVTVSGNESWGSGGGGEVRGGSLDIVQSVFASNEGANGGGLLVDGAAGEVAESVFEANAGHVGGGLWWNGGFAVTHNIFRGNYAVYTGGGFGAVEASGAFTLNVVYENESGTDGAGGFTESFTGLIADNDFHDNVSGDDAGALRMLYGEAVIERNTFTANSAAGAGGAVKVSHAENQIRENTFLDNVAEEGGGIEIDDDVSLLSSNTFRGNRASYRGGAVHLNEPFYDMAIDTLVIEDNYAGYCGGAIAMDDDGMIEVPEDRWTVTATHIVASGNESREGGALCVLQGGFILQNSVLSGNVATAAGGAVFVELASVTLTNTVLTGNVASDGTIVLRSATGASVTDSIVTDNEGGVVVAEGGSPAWRYNLHHGNEGGSFSGMADPTGQNGNIEEDPLFVDAAAADFHLDAASPAVNAGDPTRTDADGSRADMGAFGGPSGAW